MSYSAPSTPANFELPDPFFLNEDNVIAWTASATHGYGWTSYILERSTDGGSNWTQIYEGIPNWTVDSISSSTVSFRYRVSARDDGYRYSGYLYSGAIQAVTKVEITTPEFNKIPDPFWINRVNYFTWDASSGTLGQEIQYKLERKFETSSTWEVIYDGSDRSTTDWMMLPEKTSSISMNYRLSAYDENNNSSGYVYTGVLTGSNYPPFPPTQIIVNSVINGRGPLNGGENVEISWSTGMDNEGNFEGCILEVSTNSGRSFKQIYKGTNFEYSYLVEKGTENITFRVKSYDDCGLESEDYKTSNTLEVINNTAPVITPSSQWGALEFGTFSQIWQTSYSIADAENDSVTVEEKLNGSLMKSYSATLGEDNFLIIPEDMWVVLANGKHSITITATDSEGGSTTAEYTFTKECTEIEFMYKTPISSDSMPTKGIYTVEKVTPSNAIFSFHVCNNGFDSSPTWEDVTGKVLAGERFSFTNKIKTASKWGVNILVKVDRNNAGGDCYISRVQGYFK